MLIAALSGIVIVTIAAWGVVRLRRGRAAIRVALEHDGYSVVRMERRLFRQGPLFWTTTPSQTVYRVVVRNAGGRRRTVWVRWGRRWLPKPDTLELRWDE